MAVPLTTSLGFSVPLEKNIQPGNRLRVTIGKGNFRRDVVFEAMETQYSKTRRDVQNRLSAEKTER